MPTIQRKHNNTNTLNSSKSKYYFTHDTELAIIKYNSESDELVRNKLYTDHIEYAFFKLSENLINRYKFYYISDTFEEIQQIAIIFMLSKMKFFDPSRGKAFSFFDRICYFHLIQMNAKAYNDKLKFKSLNNNIQYSEYDEPYEIKNEHIKLEFFDFLIEYIEFNFDILFIGETDRKIVDSLLVLIKNKHNLNLKKKAIYLQIREMTQVKPESITRTVRKLKNLYSILYELYLNDTIDITYIPNEF